MRVIFMGTSAFAAPALAALNAIESVIVPAVYTQPPRKAGRGHKLQKSDVHQMADKLSLEVHTPEALHTSKEAAILAELAPDLILVASYGLLLPPAILAIPERCCVNIHASTLPRWRGASPIQQAILHGDATTGIDFFQMEAGLDTGPILMRRVEAVRDDDTGGSLHDRLAAISAQMVPEFIQALQNGELKAEPQAEAGIMIAPKIEKSDGIIDWLQPAYQIERQIRAFDPWPGAWTHKDNERLRIRHATLHSDHAPGEPGTIVQAPLIIATGQGALEIQTIQRAGRKPMAAAEFLRGFDLPTGTRLGQ